MRPMRTFIIQLSALAACALAASLSCSKDPAMISMVTFFVGDVTIESAGRVPRLVAVKDVIGVNDTIVTGEDSEVTVQMGEAILVNILANSSVTFVALMESEGVEMKLRRGKILSKVDKLRAQRDFHIITATATASVRGTVFMVSYENKTATVAVGEGVVAVTKPAAPPEAGKPKPPPEKADALMVEKNRTVVVTETAAPQPITKAAVKRPMNELESYYIKKISVVAPIPRASEKSGIEIEKTREGLKPQIKTIDRKINEFYPQSLKKISENYDRIDEVRLYSGKVYRGIIVSRGDRVLIMSTPRGRIEIPVRQIKYTGIKN